MRPRLVHVVVAAIVVLLAVWIARNTEWRDVAIPSPLRGEAARNPFYAAQALVTRLGATSERRESLGATSTDAIVVLSTWGWDIDAARRAELERWVEAGGRLVVDAALVSGGDAFERWSGIAREREEPRSDTDENLFGAEEPREPCEQLLEIGGISDEEAEPVYYEVCNFDRTSWLASSRRVVWALSGEETLYALRVDVGDGTVTLVNGVPFVYRELLEGDHGALLVAAADLRAGDHVVFMSEEDVTPLLGLVWQHGAPVVVVLGVFIALALWRSAVRFGPLVAPAERVRRSLGEQVLGTGRFVVRLGAGAVLQSAAVRALHEAAARRIAGYGALPVPERAAAIARLTGIDAEALAAALRPPTAQRSLELRAALALLESARRRIIVKGSRVEAWKQNPI